MLPSETSWLHGPLRRGTRASGGGVDRDRSRADRLASEIHQPGVVADVRVRQEDAVRQAARR